MLFYPFKVPFYSYLNANYCEIHGTAMGNNFNANTNNICIIFELEPTQIVTKLKINS